MKKAFFITLLATFFSACTYDAMYYQGKIYKFDTTYKTRAEALQKAQEMAEIEKAEAEKVAKEKEEKEKLEAKANFKKALNELLTSECSTDKWPGYEIASAFNNSKKLKLSPFKLMWATAYESRHLSSDFLLFQESARNMGLHLIKDYTNEEIAYGYYNLLPTLSKEQEEVFNSIVEKYNKCYEQLK